MSLTNSGSVELPYSLFEREIRNSNVEIMLSGTFSLKASNKMNFQRINLEGKMMCFYLFFHLGEIPVDEI